MDKSTSEYRKRGRPPSDDARPYLEVVSDGVHDGLLFPLHVQAPFRMGRHRDLDLVIPEEAESVSRLHAEVELLAEDFIELRDLGSRNGTFLDGERVTKARVADGGRIQLGSDSKLRVSWLTDTEAANHLGGFVDDLTRCGSRRRFQIDLHDAHECAVRLERPLALALLDIDHFGAFNKRHGFPCGDAVLRAVAETTRGAAAPHDIYRIGGEEICVLVPGADLDAALALGERIRVAVEATSVPWEDDALAVTASLGCASRIPTATNRARGLLRLADEGLRRAKESGRNRVACPDHG